MYYFISYHSHILFYYFTLCIFQSSKAPTQIKSRLKSLFINFQPAEGNRALYTKHPQPIKTFHRDVFSPLVQGHKVKYKETYCELPFHQNVDVDVSVCVLNFKLCFG